MKYIIFYLLTCIALSPCLGSERKVRFNDDWKFSMTDTVGAIKPEFNDSGWKNLNLPHDWSVEYRFDRNAPAGNDGAYLPTGTGCRDLSRSRYPLLLNNFNIKNEFTVKLSIFI